MISKQTNDSVPLTVLTGFLGAGKTTLLKRILSGDHGLRTAVLVNDFGAINIDAELVVSVEENVISLANGCVCCSIQEDLMATIDNLLALPEPPQYIILEASGIADPGGIAIQFSIEPNNNKIKLDSVICVIDSEQMFEPEHMQLKLCQIAAADLLLLNKIDLVSEEQILKIDQWLDENFHRHRIIKASHGEVPLALLVGSGRFDPQHLACEEEEEEKREDCSHHKHDTTSFKSWSYETDSALIIGAVEEVVRKLPVSVYRCKGVLNTVDAPDRKTILQVVGKRVSFSDGGSWKQTAPTSKIVVIASDGQIDLTSLKDQFDQCLACLFE